MILGEGRFRMVFGVIDMDTQMIQTAFDITLRGIQNGRHCRMISGGQRNGEDKNGEKKIFAPRNEREEKKEKDNLVNIQGIN